MVGLKGPMQGKGAIIREAPTWLLTANVPHGFFGRFIKRFALGAPREGAQGVHEVASESFGGGWWDEGARQPPC